MQLTRVRNVTLCSIFFAAVTSTVAPAASGRMAIQSHPDLGGKCIDVPNAQFSQGARLQMWACASIVWGQPNTEVTLGIVRKSGRSDIRVRLGDSATPGPLAQVFTYDEASQQIKIGSLCVEVLGVEAIRKTPSVSGPARGRKINIGKWRRAAITIKSLG